MTNDKKTNSATRRKTYSAPALEKGLDILEALASEPEGLTSAGIAGRLGRPMGQLFRMLVVLQQRGYVAYAADTERYQMTLKVFDLAHGLAPVKRLNLVAGPLMKRLTAEISQSCHLVVYYEGKGHIVAQQSAAAARVLSVRLGAEAPLLDSCSGHLLLAFAMEMDRDAMLAAIPRSHKKPSRSSLRNMIERVRKDGFERIASAQIQGVQDIGYPIFERDGRIAAALVVPFLSFLDGSHPVEIEDAQTAIERVAEEISRGLGYSGSPQRQAGDVPSGV